MAYLNQAGSKKDLYGTNAERLAISTSSISGRFITFYETDTNSKYEWKGSKWVQTSINGAASVTTNAASTNAYGAHIETLGSSFTGVASGTDNAVIYQSPNVTYANNVVIICTVGTVDVEVSADGGTTYRLATLRTTTAAGVVVSDDIEIVATEQGILRESDVGKFSHFRILNKGGTASTNANGRYGVA